MLRKVVGCFGTGDRIPGDSDSDSSGRGCKTDLLLLANEPGGSEGGSGSRDDEVSEVSAAGGTGVV